MNLFLLICAVALPILLWRRANPLPIVSLVVFVLLASFVSSVARKDGPIRYASFMRVTDAVEVQEGPQHFFD